MIELTERRPPEYVDQYRWNSDKRRDRHGNKSNLLGGSRWSSQASRSKPSLYRGATRMKIVQEAPACTAKQQGEVPTRQRLESVGKGALEDMETEVTNRKSRDKADRHVAGGLKIIAASTPRHQLIVVLLQAILPCRSASPDRPKPLLDAIRRPAWSVALDDLRRCWWNGMTNSHHTECHQAHFCDFSRH